MMNKIIAALSLIAIVVAISCNREPYVEHELKFAKLTDSCHNEARPFKVTSNVGGQRYEFQWCLPTDFSKEKMSVQRNGDTIIVDFPEAAEAQPTGMFNLTLDIDAYPGYQHLRIDHDVYTIAKGK